MNFPAFTHTHAHTHTHTHTIRCLSKTNVIYFFQFLKKNKELEVQVGLIAYLKPEVERQLYALSTN